MADVFHYLELRAQGLTKGHKYRQCSKVIRYLLEGEAAKPVHNQPCEFSGEPRATFLMDFSPNMLRVASTHGDHTVRVTDIRTGKCTHILTGHPRTPWCLAFNPASDDILASGCLGGEVRIWDLLGGGSEVLLNPCFGQVITSLAFHPTGQVLVFATMNCIYFWDWSKSTPFAVTKTNFEYERIRWLRFDPFGQHLFTGIANNTTVHREGVSNVVHISDDSPDLSGDGDDLGLDDDRSAQQQLNRMRYQRLLQRFMTFQQDRSNRASTFTYPETSSPRSPVHEEGLDYARQYAHHMTETVGGAIHNAQEYARRETEQARNTPSLGSQRTYLSFPRTRAAANARLYGSTPSAASSASSSLSQESDPYSQDEDRGRNWGSYWSVRSRLEDLQTRRRWGRYQPSFFSRHDNNNSDSNNNNGFEDSNNNSNNNNLNYGNGDFNSYRPEVPVRQASRVERLVTRRNLRHMSEDSPIRRRTGWLSANPAEIAGSSAASSSSHVPYQNHRSRNENAASESLDANEFQILPVDQGRENSAITNAARNINPLNDPSDSTSFLQQQEDLRILLNQFSSRSSEGSSASGGASAVTSLTSANPSLLLPSAASTSGESGEAVPRPASGLSTAASARPSLEHSLDLDSGMNGSSAIINTDVFLGVGHNEYLETPYRAPTTSAPAMPVSTFSTQDFPLRAATPPEQETVNTVLRNTQGSPVAIGTSDGNSVHIHFNNASSSWRRRQGVYGARSMDLPIGSDYRRQLSFLQDRSTPRHVIDQTSQTLGAMSLPESSDQGTDVSGLDDDSIAAIGWMDEFNGEQVPSVPLETDIPPDGQEETEQFSLGLNSAAVLRDIASDAICQDLTNIEPVSDTNLDENLDTLSSTNMDVTPDSLQNTIPTPGQQESSDDLPHEGSPISNQCFSNSNTDNLIDINESAAPYSQLSSAITDFPCSVESQHAITLNPFSQSDKENGESASPCLQKTTTAIGSGHLVDGCATSTQLIDNGAKLSDSHVQAPVSDYFSVDKEQESSSNQDSSGIGDSVRTCWTSDSVHSSSQEHITDSSLRSEEQSSLSETLESSCENALASARDIRNSLSSLLPSPPQPVPLSSVLMPKDCEGSTSQGSLSSAPHSSCPSTVSASSASRALDSFQVSSQASSENSPFSNLGSIFGVGGSSFLRHKLAKIHARGVANSSSASSTSVTCSSGSILRDSLSRPFASTAPSSSTTSSNQFSITSSTVHRTPSTYPQPVDSASQLRSLTDSPEPSAFSVFSTSSRTAVRYPSGFRTSSSLLNPASANPTSSSILYPPRSGPQPQVSTSTLSSQSGNRSSQSEPQATASSSESHLSAVRDVQERLQQAVQQLRDVQTSVRELTSTTPHVRVRPDSVTEYLEMRVSELDRRISNLEENYSSRLQELRHDYLMRRIQSYRERRRLIINTPYLRRNAVRLRDCLRSRNSTQTTGSSRDGPRTGIVRTDREGPTSRSGQFLESLVRGVPGRRLPHNQTSSASASGIPSSVTIHRAREEETEGGRRAGPSRDHRRRWHSLQPVHLHPDYSSSIVDDTINRPNETIQHIMNRTIAGAFLTRDDQAVASNIVPQTHRIQRWDVSQMVVPDISNASANVVVKHCKLHNDASCDLSKDGSILATFVPSHRGFPDDNILGVFSLRKGTFAQCLYTKSFGPNAISVSISPENSYIMVGLAAKRLLFFSVNQMVAQIYKFHKEKAGERSMKHVTDLFHPCSQDSRTHVSVNSARWLPGVGEGMVYGTNRGDLHFCRPGSRKVHERESPRPCVASASRLAGALRRRNAQVHNTTATQTTTVSIRRTASTQTLGDLREGMASSSEDQ